MVNVIGDYSSQTGRAKNESSCLSRKLREIGIPVDCFHSFFHKYILMDDLLRGKYYLRLGIQKVIKWKQNKTKHCPQRAFIAQEDGWRKIYHINMLYHIFEGNSCFGRKAG